MMKLPNKLSGWLIWTSRTRGFHVQITNRFGQRVGTTGVHRYHADAEAEARRIAMKHGLRHHPTINK